MTLNIVWIVTFLVLYVTFYESHLGVSIRSRMGSEQAIGKKLRHEKRKQALEAQEISKEEVAYNAGRGYIDDRVHPEIQSLHNVKTFKNNKPRYRIPIIMEYIMMQYGGAWITQTWQQGDTKIVPILEPQYEQYFWQGIYDKITEKYAPETYSSDDAKESALQWSQAYQQAIQEVE